MPSGVLDPADSPTGDSLMTSPLPTFRRLLPLGLVCLVAAGLVVSWSWAQQIVPPPAPPAEAEKATPPEAGPEKEKPEFPPFEEVTKDAKQIRPDETTFLTLYYNEKKDELWAQIPKALLGQHFLFAASLSGGPEATGMQAGHSLVYFQQMDKQLVLMEVDPRYVGREDKVLSDLIKRTFRDTILKAVPIHTMKGADPVIDLADLFKQDLGGLGAWLGGAINPSLSRWVEHKAFPENVELAVDLAVMEQGPYAVGGRPVTMHYSLSHLPKTDYQPRHADTRIGYFLTARMDWTKGYDAYTLFDRYVHRWNLTKQDPDLKLSPPKKQIVWYIEKTVPIRLRHYIKEGILEWNKAFEKCGIVDAMTVRQQRDDDETANYDPEDVRYNFIRWMVTGGGYAAGPSRANPMTGEIFDADVVFDDSLIRAELVTYGTFTGGGGTPPTDGYQPVIEDFLNSHPQWQYYDFRQYLLPDVVFGADRERREPPTPLPFLQHQDFPPCEICNGMRHQLSLAGAVMQAKGITEIPEEFLGQVVRYITTHEVGHCLGLMHNFKASSWRPLNEILEMSATGEPTIGSVMEYSPPVFLLRDEKQTLYTTGGLGPYDYWAIEYGYRPVEAPYTSEDELLKSITDRVAEPGHAFGNDLDAIGFISPDPLTNRWDLGADPIEYAKHEMKLAADLLKDLPNWAVKDGEDYYRMRRLFARLVYEYGRVGIFAARFAGGQYLHRDHKGDPDARAPFVNVPVEKQREGLQFVCNTIFAEHFYDFDPQMLNSLAPGRWLHWGTDAFDLFTEVPVHEIIARNQYYSLLTLMNPFTVGRIFDNELKVPAGEDRYTLAEHLGTLSDSIWSELDRTTDKKWTSREPFVSSIRRDLQRMHLQMLLNLVLGEPGLSAPAEATGVARYCLTNLDGKIQKRLTGGSLDQASQAHLSDVHEQITKALEAIYTRGGVMPRGRIMMMGQPAPPIEKIQVVPEH
jgi:hypothetical protein